MRILVLVWNILRHADPGMIGPMLMIMGAVLQVIEAIRK